MKTNLSKFGSNRSVTSGLLAAVLAVVFLGVFFPSSAVAQDQDDPPSRVGRLGYMEGSVSFQPAGESEWVEAVPNRPMTTGDKIWADRDSRAEVQMGSATVNLAANTGVSFLNLDDRTVQIELSSGVINVRVRDLDRDSVFEIDTPNQAFSIYQPGRYRVEASEDGTYTVVTIREGEGESTGNGQSYTLHSGQRTTFSGTDSLNAEVEQIGSPDDFDNWSDGRQRKFDDSPSARYCPHDMVGYQDLDDNGDWRPSSQYGNVWYPRVDANWSPYHEGHWAWIDPWGWTWVDDERWGYAPFHYGRWVSDGGRWGWIPGPREQRAVYAPALVAFVGGVGIGVGGNVAWFPLGPREVYVPTYQVSPAYVNRVNISNTTVNTTTVTNVYNTTIVNKSTTINNVTYVNRNVRGAVTAVPQQAFASAQPVAKSAVAVNAQQLASAPVNVRAAVPPARAAVMGAHANTAGHVAAPPQAVANRAVIAKAAPPPPPPSFAARQQVLAQHPGQAVPRQELQKMRPANPQQAALVKRAPAAKPATATPAPARPANQPGNQPVASGQPRPGNPPANRPQPNQPAANNRPDNKPQPNQPAPNNRPDNKPQPNQPAPNNPPDNNRPQPNQPAPNNRPDNKPQPNQPAPNNRPDNKPQPNQPAPNNRPDNNRPQPNQPAPNNRPDNKPQPNQPAPNNRPDNNRPQPNQPAPNNRPDNKPQPNQPAPNNRPDNNRPQPNQPAPNNRPDNKPQPNQPAPNNRPDNNRPDANRPQPNQPNNRPEANPPKQNRPNEAPARTDRPPSAQSNERPQQQHPQPKQTPEEKKKQDEQKKQDQKPQTP